MDLSQLKKISSISYDVALQKQNALKRADSDTITVYNGHIFRADGETICLVRTLFEHNKEFFVLDTNQNPVRIIDPENFLKTLIEKNQSALNTYHRLYETLKNKRS